MTFQAPIAALASGAEPSAIAIVRLSGLGCFDLIKKALKPKFKSQTFESFLDRRMHLCDFVSADQKTVIDEPMVAFFQGPKSFTGEDSVEIYCHGSPYVVKTILKELYSIGFREAEPGEFTKRAFLNGKLDLTAAEGIKELVEAQSHQQWVAARQLATGTLKDSINYLRKQTIEAMAYLEAQIDFPDEGDTAHVKVKDVEIRIEKVQAEILRLIDTYESGKVATHGLRLVLMGAPNAGKSTLMNTLLRKERAIVTNIPGTTRDFIEEPCLLKGRLIQVIDVAGIRDTSEEVEAIGVQMAKDLAKKADIVAFLASADGDSSEAAEKWLDAQVPGKCLKILTKSDLNDNATKDGWLSISCKTNHNLDRLTTHLVDFVDQHIFKIKEDSFITSARHAEALRSAQESLQNFYSALEDGLGEELLAFELQNVNRALKSIIGEVDSEDILDKIFSTFCVGK